MKNKLRLSNIRDIKSTFKRFLSLTCMSLLGVGFFVGIKITSPDMLVTIDNYLDDRNVYDLKITSTLGFNDNNIKAIEELESVDQVELIHSKDQVAIIDKEEYAIKFIEVHSKMNEITITKGRLPQKKNEIVVEQALLTNQKLKVGDTITMDDDQEYQIVGVAESPLYFSYYRDTTTVGNGKINYYAFANKDFFDETSIEEIYLTVEGAKELETSSDEYVDKIEKVEKEIEDITEEQQENRYQEVYGAYLSNPMINTDTLNLAPVKWYTNSRENNSAYNDFINATDNLKQIGNVFPLVFYVIAVLVSLITMTRMVEDDRSDIGTLKSLGFNNLSIISKYVHYALITTILGGIIGIAIGTTLLPIIIWDIYGIMFTLPPIHLGFNLLYTTLGIVITALCIGLSTIYAAIKVLKETPANLMRPKAPKAGRRVLLERISIIWRHLKFSNKITVRNIFRYKSRVLASILGTAGCTALILAGFGLKDSIQDISKNQFNHVFLYDAMISFTNTDNVSKLKNSLEERDDVLDVVQTRIDSLVIVKDEKEYATNVIVEGEDSLDTMIQLNDVNNQNKQIHLKEGEIILSEKLAKLADIKPEDTITIKKNNKEYRFKVQTIVENYIDHYSYMTKQTYENEFGEYEDNSLLLTYNHLNEQEEKNLNTDIMNQSEGAIITTSRDIKNTVDDMMSSLDSVVFILIVSSACLAFVVLYNLANINIIERKREIATLKVLGFYHREVDSYIIKESILLNIIGIALGLVAGLYLCFYIISTCETDNMMFTRHINVESYLLSACITAIFVIIVSIFTHYQLKKIDMIESLKSVE